MTIFRPVIVSPEIHAMWVVDGFGGTWAWQQPIDFNCANYVIMCVNGDWSGFRTFEEIQNQKMPNPDDEETHMKYWVERR
jgi:hypothetical protein